MRLEALLDANPKIGRGTGQPTLNQPRTANARAKAGNLKLAVVVHGRFYAFDLARELIKQGTDLTLFTNYPKTIVQKFGVPPERVVNFLTHGVCSRLVTRIFADRPKGLWEPMLHRSFGGWAARATAKQEWDVIHCLSGVSEELIRTFAARQTLVSMVRASAHIEAQRTLIEGEQRRAGVRMDTPSDWIVARENREYALAEMIIVLSSFAQRSFLERNVPAEKLRVLPLGSELTRFRPLPDVVEQRCARILTAKPLRVLTVGSFSFQKGILDLVAMAEALRGKMSFTFVGSVPAEGRGLRRQADGLIHFIPKMKQCDLPAVYASADVFVFPTIQDGYAVVLAQAQSSGLPILATTNCAAPDIIDEGQTGWVLPIRSPVGFADRLRWCHEHRADLAACARSSYQTFKPRDWSDVATDLRRIYEG